MPHAGDLSPLDVGSLLPDLIRQRASGLAQNLEMTDEPVLDQLVLVERVPPTSGIAFDAIDRFDHVADSFVVISHNATASATMRSRIRLLMPLSVTTSTWWPIDSLSSITRAPRSNRLR